MITATLQNRYAAFVGDKFEIKIYNPGTVRTHNGWPIGKVNAYGPENSGLQGRMNAQLEKKVGRYSNYRETEGERETRM